MADLGSLVVRVGAQIDNFEKAMGTVSQRLNAIDRDSNKAISGFDKLGDRATALGTSLIAGFTVPLVGVSAAAVKVAGDFEKSLAKIEAFGGITGESLERLKQQALDLGAQTQFSAKQAAEGMAVFASAGFTAEQIYAAMPGTLSLAAAGQISVGEAAVFVSDTLGQFALKAGDTNHIADVMAKTLNATQASMSDLALTMKYVGPTAHDAGMSLEDTSAAIIALDKAGLRGSEAGTGLRGVIASLTGPSGEAAKAMQNLGINIGDTEGHIRPIPEIVSQLQAGLGRLNTDVERQAALQQIFGREAGSAARKLIEVGGPALEEYSRDLHNADGAADALAKKLNSGLNYAADQLGGTIETAGIALGQVLIPAVKAGMGTLTGLINDFALPAIKWFSELPEPLKYTGIAIAGVGAAAGPAIFAAGQFAGSLADVSRGVFSAKEVLEKFPAAASLMQTALSGIGVGVLAVGAAFVGWKLGEWIYNQHIPAIDALGNSIAKMLMKFDTWRAFIEWFRGDLPEANEQIVFLEKNLKELGITTERGARTQDEYVKYLKKTIDEVTDHGNAEKIRVLQVKAGTDAQTKQTAANKAAVKQLEEYRRSIGLTGEVTKEGTKATDAIAASLKQHTEYLRASNPQILAVSDAEGRLASASWAAHDADKNASQARAELTALKASGNATTQQLTAATIKLADADDNAKIAATAFKDAQSDLSKAKEKAKADAELLTKSIDELDGKMSKVALETAPEIIGAFGETSAETLTLQRNITDAQIAMSKMGITTSKSLGEAADAANQAYAAIVDDTNSTTGEIQQAWEKAVKSQLAYAESIGDEQQIAALQSLLNAHRETSSQIQTGWQNVNQSLAAIDVAPIQHLGDVSREMYENLQRSGVGSAGQIRDAFVASLNAVADAYYAQGQSMPASQQILLAQLEQQQRNFQETSINGWRIMWHAIYDNAADMFGAVKGAIFSGDWASAKDRILDDLKGMGEAVLTKFTKPFENAISELIANGITKLLSSTGLGGISDTLAGLAGKIGGIFSSGAAAQAAGGLGGTLDAAVSTLPDLNIPGIGGIGDLASKIPGLGGLASGASSAVSGIMGGVMSALNPISMVAGVVGSIAQVLQLFGVGEQGQKDRLNIIADKTSFIAWAFDQGRVYLNTWDIRNALVGEIPGILNGLFVGVAGMASMMEGYLLPDVAAIRASMDTYLPRLSQPQMATVGGGINVYVTVQNAYGTTVQELAEIIESQIVQQIQLQGA